jgi:predicted metal-dependent phosphoesterase TrpH
MNMKEERTEWVKVDLHIHTLDDPKDVIDYSAHQLLERARELGFGVLAITLHDAVFDRAEVFADAAAMGILLISAAEMRLEGADVIILNVTGAEAAQLRTFADLRQLRARRGASVFTIAPHPFYVLGGSIGPRLLQEIDCFDGIELCHFHKWPLNPNRRAARVARKFKKSLIATSDAHKLHAFGRHYTSIPRAVEASRRFNSETRPASGSASGAEPTARSDELPAQRESASTYPPLTIDYVFSVLRNGPMRLSSPPCTWKSLFSAIYWIFLAHPRQMRERKRMGTRGRARPTPDTVRHDVAHL